MGESSHNPASNFAAGLSKFNRARLRPNGLRMSQKNDGGPAFPVSTRWDGPSEALGHQDSDNTWQFPGMTLRDYFAAKALSAIVARAALNACGDFVASDGLLQHSQAANYAADTAYRFADAMLAARAK